VRQMCLDELMDCMGGRMCCAHLETIERLQAELLSERHRREALEALLPDATLELEYEEACAAAPKLHRPGVPWRHGVIGIAGRRASVLIVLLLFQSISSSVLNHYDDLIHQTILPLFLTMLVGAGGNAGNQATVRSISGLVSGEYRPKKGDFIQVVKREVAVGFICASLLTAIGFLRVLWFTGGAGGFLPVLAISLSLFLIVITSALIGSGLPFVLTFIGLDAEHAGPTIQVIMDILGVLITCITTERFLGFRGQSPGLLVDGTAP